MAIDIKDRPGRSHSWPVDCRHTSADRLQKPDCVAGKSSRLRAKAQVHKTLLDEQEREKQREEERKLLIHSLRAELVALAWTLCSRKILGRRSTSTSGPHRSRAVRCKCRQHSMAEGPTRSIPSAFDTLHLPHECRREAWQNMTICDCECPSLVCARPCQRIRGQSRASRHLARKKTVWAASFLKSTRAPVRRLFTSLTPE